MGSVFYRTYTHRSNSYLSTDTVKPKLIFNGECKDGQERRMYEGDQGEAPYIHGDNPGSPDERIARCSMACREKKKPVDGRDWTKFVAQGFIVAPEDTFYGGRCYCETKKGFECSKKLDAAGRKYNRYDWRSIGLCCVGLAPTGFHGM